MTRWICGVDRASRIVMRNRKAVMLTILEFAIFDTLHRVRVRDGKQMNSSALCDEVYRGVSNPSTLNTIHVCVNRMNAKLVRLGLKVRGHKHREHSFYQIVVL